MTTTDVPKPAKSGYLHFIGERRLNPANTEGITPTEFIKKSGADWKSLDDASKKKYEEIALQDKARYTAEKESWMKEHPGQEFPKKEKKNTKVSNKSEKSKVEDDTPKQDEGKEKKKSSKKKNDEPATAAPPPPPAPITIEQEPVLEVEPETVVVPTKKKKTTKKKE